MGLQSSGPGKRPSEGQVWSLQPVSSGVVGCAVVETSEAVSVVVVFGVVVLSVVVSVGVVVVAVGEDISVVVVPALVFV